MPLDPRKFYIGMSMKAGICKNNLKQRSLDISNIKEWILSQTAKTPTLLVYLNQSMLDIHHVSSILPVYKNLRCIQATFLAGRLAFATLCPNLSSHHIMLLFWELNSVMQKKLLIRPFHGRGILWNSDISGNITPMFMKLPP